jgi:hypothetical protein
VKLETPKAALEMINNRQQGLFEYAKRIGFSECTEKDRVEFSEAETKILELLKRGGWHTATKIIEVSGQREGLRRLRALRQKGFEIEKQKFEGREFIYRLKEAA